MVDMPPEPALEAYIAKYNLAPAVMGPRETLRVSWYGVVLGGSWSTLNQDAWHTGNPRGRVGGGVGDRWLT